MVSSRKSIHSKERESEREEMEIAKDLEKLSKRLTHIQVKEKRLEKAEKKSLRPSKIAKKVSVRKSKLVKRK